MSDIRLVAIKEKIFEDLWEEFDRQPTLKEVDQNYDVDDDSDKE